VNLPPVSTSLIFRCPLAAESIREIWCASGFPSPAAIPKNSQPSFGFFGSLAQGLSRNCRLIIVGHMFALFHMREARTEVRPRTNARIDPGPKRSAQQSVARCDCGSSSHLIELRTSPICELAESCRASRSALSLSESAVACSTAALAIFSVAFSPSTFAFSVAVWT